MSHLQDNRTRIRRAAANQPDGRRGLLSANCKVGLGTWNVTLHQTGNLTENNRSQRDPRNTM